MSVTMKVELRNIFYLKNICPDALLTRSGHLKQEKTESERLKDLSGKTPGSWHPPCPLTLHHCPPSILRRRRVIDQTTRATHEHAVKQTKRGLE